MTPPGLRAAGLRRREPREPKPPGYQILLRAVAESTPTSNRLFADKWYTGGQPQDAKDGRPRSCLELVSRLRKQFGRVNTRSR